MLKINEIQKLTPIKLLIPEYTTKLINIDIKNLFICSSNDNQDYNQTHTIDYYTCKICSYIVKEPLCCLECDDLFCSNCISEWKIKSNFCPHCCKPFKHNRLNKMTKYMLNNCSIKCPVGCKERFKYENLYNHFIICKNTKKLLICKLCDFEIKINLNDSELANYMNKDNAKVNDEQNRLNITNRISIKDSIYQINKEIDMDNINNISNDDDNIIIDSSHVRLCLLQKQSFISYPRKEFYSNSSEVS